MTIFNLYFAIFVITALALFFMALKSYKNIDIHLWTMEILMPLICFGYLGKASAQTLEGALFSNNLLYIGVIILPAIFLLSCMRIFKINPPTLLKQFIYTFAFVNLLIVWFGSYNDLYYINPELHRSNWGNYLTTSYGPLQIIHYIYIGLIFIGIVSCIVYGITHPTICNKKSVIQITIIGFCAVTLYIIQVFAKTPFDIVPLIYPFGSWFIALSYEQTFSHDVESIVASMHNDGSVNGYFAFDMKKRFLGSNDSANRIIPQLLNLHIDERIKGKYQEFRLLTGQMMNSLDEGNQKPRYWEKGGKIYQLEIQYFYIRKKGVTGGYIFTITDDTDRQKNLNYIQNFNKTLKEDLSNNTSRIKEIQQRVVFGLANTIENRDYSTGGHVKRTSEVIRIIVDKMLTNHIGNLDRVYAENIVRAAPMHDMGKIAIDNSILCKPGKLTPEEYKIMKTHPLKSGEIVNYVLQGVEEQTFVDVAFNVARFHHERWDGTGYPDNLSGLEIPLEARIMAVADVYDALVSKRCYKDAMSFEEAAKVMTESMGTHFDPMMKEVFELCRTDLEKYYKNIE